MSKRDSVLSTGFFKLAKVSRFFTVRSAAYFSFIYAIPDIRLAQVVVERSIRFSEDSKQIMVDWQSCSRTPSTALT
jgi:hypothetical protein